MAIAKKITSYLEKNHYKFQSVDHKKTYTAWDVAQTGKIKPEEVVKALAVKVDKEYVIALVPANRKLDKKKFLKFLKTLWKKEGKKGPQKVDFAKEAWMKKNLPGKVGAIPPFPGLLKLEVYADNLLAKKKTLYLGSGEYQISLKLSVKEYFQIEKINKGSFSQKR